MNRSIQIGKNGMQAFQLPGIFGEEENGILPGFPVLQIPDQQFKLPVKCRLCLGMEFDLKKRTGRWMHAKFNPMELIQLVQRSCGIQKIRPADIFFEF
jgi:hypothetical protein